MKRLFSWNIFVKEGLLSGHANIYQSIMNI